MKIILENERPISWNKFYSGMHWSARKEEADRVHELVKYTLLADWGENIWLLPYRVDIHITVYFKNRPQDPDNICSKLYIDGLCSQVIEDDARKFVRMVTVQSEVDKDNPRVEIDIQEVK